MLFFYYHRDRFIIGWRDAHYALRKTLCEPSRSLSSEIGEPHFVPAILAQEYEGSLRGSKAILE